MRPALVMPTRHASSSTTPAKLPAHARRTAPFPQTGSGPGLGPGNPASTRLDPTYRARRPRVWAVGFAVIIISGTILGAQLKSRQQAQEQAEVRAAVGVGEVSIGDHEKDDDHGRSHVQQPASTSADTQPQSVSSAIPRATPPLLQVSEVEAQRQITFLTERRAALVAQKTSLEQKLEEVRRKQKVTQEMEARKKQGQTIDASR